MRIEAPPRRRRLVSLTPLIDVVFILLIFFMLASSYVEWQAFSVAAPAEGTASAEADEDPLRVVVEAEAYRIGGERVAPGALRARLERIAGQRPERAVQIAPAEGVAVRPVVEALDAAAAAGMSNVSVAREGR